MKKRDLSKNDKKQICQTLLEDLIKVSWDQIFGDDFYSTEARGFDVIWIALLAPTSPAACAGACSV